MRTARRITQIAFLAAFIALLVGTRYTGTDEIRYPVKVFFEINPLVGLTTFLATHWIPTLLLLGLIVIGVTLVLGRVFCGWVCPMGTMLHGVHVLTRPRSSRRQGEWKPWQSWKYLILVAILMLSVLGLNLSGFMDPISLAVRSIGLSVGPALEEIVRAVIGVMYDVGGPIGSAGEAAYGFLRNHVLSFEQPRFAQSLFLGAVFAAVFALLWLAARFWCRALCPLGALLGYVSRRSALRLQFDGDACIACGDCLEGCQGGAEPVLAETEDGGEPGRNRGPVGSWRISECMHCWNCVESCPTEAISYKMSLKPSSPPLNIGRRRLLGTAIGAAAAVPFITLGLDRARANPALIRPPGALIEEDFLERCIKCGECMKVCPTNGIQPTLMQAGFEGIWSPVMNFRAGYCEYNCTLCGQVCPTQALEKMPLEEKVNFKIGLAFIDVNRCLPYAYQTPCIVCEEHCPTPTKAIWFEEKEVRTRDGETRLLKLPVVDPEHCIGCGICEYMCPVADKPAIYCTSTGETRNPDNRPILGL